MMEMTPLGIVVFATCLTLVGITWSFYLDWLEELRKEKDKKNVC